MPGKPSNSPEAALASLKEITSGIHNKYTFTTITEDTFNRVFAVSVDTVTAFLLNYFLHAHMEAVTRLLDPKETEAAVYTETLDSLETYILNFHKASHLFIDPKASPECVLIKDYENAKIELAKMLEIAEALSKAIGVNFVKPEGGSKPN